VALNKLNKEERRRKRKRKNKKRDFQERECELGEKCRFSAFLSHHHHPPPNCCHFEFRLKRIF